MSPKTALGYNVCNLAKITRSNTVCARRNEAAQIHFVDAKMDKHLGEVFLPAFLRAPRPVKFVHSERLNPSGQSRLEGLKVLNLKLHILVYRHLSGLIAILSTFFFHLQIYFSKLHP